MPGANGRRDARRKVIIAHNWFNWLPAPPRRPPSPRLRRTSRRTRRQPSRCRLMGPGSAPDARPASGQRSGAITLAQGAKRKAQGARPSRRGRRTADATFIMGILYRHATHMSRGYFVFFAGGGGPLRLVPPRAVPAVSTAFPSPSQTVENGCRAPRASLHRADATVLMKRLADV
jgi:hypothetical protein